MKRFASLALCVGLLAACQSGPPATGSVDTGLRAQTVSQSKGPRLASLNLPLNAALKAELQKPDDEAEPRSEVYSEELVNQIMDPRYVHAHSFYFDHLENGSSSIELILKHDGHAREAELVAHWRPVLSAASLWPDRNSTTYQGRYTALEHGQVGPNKGWFKFYNASYKAQEYYQLALKAWHRDLPADHPSQSDAWSWLGRTSHFLQDMSVPFHTKSMVRPAQALHHHPYELSCEETFDHYMPSQNHNLLGVWSQGPYPATGQWGLYYPPGTTAESMILQLAEQSEPFYKLVNKREGASSANWEKTRAVMIPLGAKLTSGFIMAFLRDVGAL